MKHALGLVCALTFACSDGSKSDRPLAAADASASATPDAGVLEGGQRTDARTDPPPHDAQVLRVDGGSRDGATDTGAPPPDAAMPIVGSCDGLRFCDDFEGAQLDPGWESEQGTLELDATRAALRGKQSLHVHTENNQPAIMAHRKSFPMPNDRFWVRLFVNIKNLPTPNWAHWSLMWVIPEGAQWQVVEHRLGGQNTTDKKLYWGVGTDKGPSGDWTNIDTRSTVALDRWQCIEWLIDSTQDVSQVYRDGVEVPGLGTTRTTKHGGNSSVPYDLPPTRTFWLGFFYYQGETPGQTYDLWIDGFALDEERIGCER